MTDITITMIRSEDIPDCLRLLSDTFGPYADRARFDLTAAFNYAMGYPPIYFVARSGGLIVGLVGTVELWRGSPRYDIPWLAVAADHRGRGIGLYLVRTCLATLPARSIVYVETDKPDFYARCGFSDRGPTEGNERLMSVRAGATPNDEATDEPRPSQSTPNDE